MTNRGFVVFILVALLAVMTTPITAQDNTATIVDIAAGNEAFSTLITGVQAAGLVDMLTSEGPFTVFAPTDEAFAATLEELDITTEELLANTELLTQILRYHVVQGIATEDTIIGLLDENGTASIATLEGSDIVVSATDDGRILLNSDPVLENSGTEVVETDIMASNGVIHVINRVLLPALAPPAEEDVEIANIRLGHFSPDAPAVEIYINGELSGITPLQFPELTGWIELVSGTHEIAVAPAGASLDDAVIGPLELAFNPDTWTTIAIIGSAENDTLTTQTIIENISEIPEGQARVLVFHAIEGAPTVDVLANGTTLIPLLGYPGTRGNNDGAFEVDVPAGIFDIQIVPSAARESVIIDAPGIEFVENNFYFVAAIGVPDAPEIFTEFVNADRLLNGEEEDTGETTLPMTVEEPTPTQTPTPEPEMTEETG